MKKTSAKPDPRELLLQLIDDAYNGKAWHGPNLRGPLRQVSAKQAVRRPRGGRRNIAEIVLHCAYWKYAVARRILGGKRGSFPLKGSNWFEVPAKLTEKQWREYVALLDEQHAALREAVATADWSQLCKTKSAKAAGSARQAKSMKSSHATVADHVHGIAMHDTYHAGQVRTIKTLCTRATGPK